VGQSVAHAHAVAQQREQRVGQLLVVYLGGLEASQSVGPCA